MELSKKEIKKMDSKDIFKLMLPIINDIYQQSKDIGISEQQYYDLALVEITNSKKTFNENISYTDFIKNKILSALSEQIGTLITNQETQVRIIDNYISQKFTEVNNYKDSIKYLTQLTTFFEKYDIIPHPELITELVNKNELFTQIIELIIRKFHSQITSGKLETIFDNSSLILIIETYCMLKNIKINEVDDYNNDSYDYETKDSVRHYLKEIGRIPMLSVEKEREVAKQVAKGDTQAKQLLIESNLRLVVSMAKKYVGRGLPFLDLIQEGNLGLMKAADRYDVNRGFRFSTYATWWIKQAIIKAIKNNGRNIRIPVYMQEDIQLYRRIVNKLEIKLNRQPTIKEIADEMKLPISRVTKLYNLQSDTVSINTLIGDDSDSELEDLIPASEENPEDIAMNNSLKYEIRKLFDDCHLKEKEISVIMLRYGFNDKKPMTLEEIGKKLHITRERVRQIESGAIKKLKNPKYIKAFVAYMQNPDKALESLQSSRNERKKADTSTNTVSTIDLAHNISSSIKTEEPAKQNPKPEAVLIENKLIEQQSTITEIELIPLIQENNDIKKEDYIKMLELLRTSTFNQIMSILTTKEAIIIALRLGYINEKIFSTKSIADFLGIEEKEVIETTKKVLLVYKESINNFLDDAIAVATDQAGQERVLSMKNSTSQI